MSEAQTIEYDPRSRVRILLGVVLLLLVLLLVALGVFFFRVLAPAGVFGLGDLGETGDMQWIRSMYGFGPSADEQLFAPTSVAIAPNGQIYATDPQRARIMVFNPGGSFARLLHTGAGGVGRGQFMRPEGLDIDEQGNLYIADSDAEKVIVFDSADQFVTEWPVDEVRGVYVQGEDVYVLAIGRIFAYKKDGTKVGEFGQRGPKPGDIEAYQGIVADEGSIYIADSLNQRVQRFDRKTASLIWAQPTVKGGFIIAASAEGTASSETSEAAPYDLPQDLAFDGSGRLVVLDAFAFRLIVVDPETGAVEASYGDFGEQDGLFLYPTGIDYDSARDWFAVADTRNNRVQVVRIPGTGGGAAAAARRALTSPLRYCAIPLALLLLALLIIGIGARRARRGQALEESVLEPEVS